MHIQDIFKDMVIDMRDDKRASIDARTFVEVWQRADTVQAVAEVLGVKPSSASQRATNLRREGVKLKKMPKNKRAYNVDELNELASKHSPENNPGILD